MPDFRRHMLTVVLACGILLLALAVLPQSVEAHALGADPGMAGPVGTGLAGPTGSADGTMGDATGTDCRRHAIHQGQDSGSLPGHPTGTGSGDDGHHDGTPGSCCASGCSPGVIAGAAPLDWRPVPQRWASWPDPAPSFTSVDSLYRPPRLPL